LNYWSTELHL